MIKNKTSEKKVEQKFYPDFVVFLKKVYEHYSVEDYYETADFPEFIKEKLSQASKTGNGTGKPDAIFYVKNDIETNLFIFEAKSNNIEKAKTEAKHYADYLKDITANLFVCSIDKDHFRLVHFQTEKELPIKSKQDLLSLAKEDFLIKLKQLQITAKNEGKRGKDELLLIIKNLNNSLREVGLSGQDRIDFASSLFLIKEIYDLVDEDFKKTYFSQIINSKKLLTTLKQINTIATLDEIKNIFPDFSHLIVDNQLINLEKFSKVIAKNNSENNSKSSITADSLNEKIKNLLNNDVLNLSQADFDFRGLIVEEFTHGNKGRGVSKEYGEFFTPRHIIKFIIELAKIKKGDKIFDPAFGTGGFLIEAFKKLASLNENQIDDHLKKYSIYGSELHDWNVKATKASLIALGDGHSNLINTDFIHGFNNWQIDNDPNSIDKMLIPNIVLMNPPYSLGGDMTEWHFVKKCFDQILEQSRKDNIERKLLVVLPYESIERKDTILHSYSRFIDAYISLPYGVFQKYTDVRTQIVILNTTEKYESPFLSEPLFLAKVEADGFTLDSYRRQQNANDLPLILERYDEYLKIRSSNRIILSEIKALEIRYSVNSEITEEEYKDSLYEKEKEFENSYNAMMSENNIKTSLLSFKEISAFSHFDKALWNKNKEAPTLGTIDEDNKKIVDYFNIVEEKVCFYENAYENYPYIEIGGIELKTSFYVHSDKLKCSTKGSAKDGEIKGGILGKKGDVLISMVRTYRGGFTILKEDAVVSSVGFLVLRAKGDISGIELLSMLKDNLPKLVRYINYVGNGKTYPKMEKLDFVQIFVNKESATRAKESFRNSLLEEIELMFS
jgi:type I restriction-modification system DNA methylase subunit